jgi:hypothetical protein
MEEETVDLKDLLLSELDSDLITFKEYSILIRDSQKLIELIEKRAEELGFNPFFLTEEQKMAAFLCMPPEDLKPIKRLLEIILKNYSLRKRLSTEHREAVKFYVFCTNVFGNPDFIKSEETKRKLLEVLTDECVGVTAFLYSWVMKKYEEKMFEGLFDFLPKKRQLAVLDAGFRFCAKSGFFEKVKGEDFES